MERLTYKSFFERVRGETLIPPIPGSIIRARELINEENSSLKTIAALIESDPSIAAKVLKTSNSAYYGFRRKVDSIETALIILGLKTTYHILESVAIISVFSKRIDTRFFRKLTYFSVLVAITCSTVAQMAGINFHGTDYTGGLLHDIGHAAIRVVSPEHALVLEKEGDPLTMGCEKEQTLIGIDHCRAGRVLGELWNLPEVTNECIERHHLPFINDNVITVPALVRFAVYIVEHLYRSKNTNGLAISVPPDHFASFVQMEKILGILNDRREEIREMVNLLAN